MRVIVVMMVMIMVMVMVVPVVVVMVIVMVFMPRMIVAVMMIVMMLRRHRIGPALGLERRVDGDDLGAQPFQQRFDGRIALEAEPPLQNLHRHVPVAQMPGEPRQRRQIGGAHLDQRLGFGHHLDQRAIIEQERVVGAQPHRLGEIKFHASAFDSEHEALVSLALRIGKDQRVENG